MDIKKDKLLNSVTAGLLVIGVLCIIYILVTRLNIGGRGGSMACVPKAETLVIDDSFMDGVFAKGDTVQLLTNFYTCNEPKVGEYVAYKFAEHMPPVVRKVAAVPGDKYKMTPDKEKKGRWWLEINGKRVTARSGEYFIESNTIPPLKTYSDYSDHLNKDEYILLSENAPSISDSSNLGLVHKKEMVAKVVE